MKKLISLMIIILLVGFSSGCSEKPLEGPVVDESTSQLQFGKKVDKEKEYWFPDYIPLIPQLYGIKTLEWTVGPSGQFISKILGKETVPYLSGDIIGTQLLFRGISLVYTDKSGFWTLKDGDNYLSVDCDLSGYPTDLILGKVYDGMIYKYMPPQQHVHVRDDLSGACHPCHDFNLVLIEIQNVTIYGKRYNKSLIYWGLDRNETFVTLNFNGKAAEIGLTLPTVNETQEHAVNNLTILGFQDGIIAYGNVSESGTLQSFAELVSVSRK